MRVAATSAMTSSTVVAADSTAAVHVASPTVRYRHSTSTTSSPSAGAMNSLTAMSIPARRTTFRLDA